MGYLKKQGIYISNESWVSFKIRKINNNLTSLDDQIRKKSSSIAVDGVVSMMFKGDWGIMLDILSTPSVIWLLYQRQIKELCHI